MLSEFLSKTAETLAENPSPKPNPKVLSEKLGLDKDFVKKVLEDPEAAQQLLGRQYLQLSALLADHLTDLVISGEISASETVSAIPAVAKTARLYLGEATSIIDSPTQALMEALKDEEGDSDFEPPENKKGD